MGHDTPSVPSYSLYTEQQGDVRRPFNPKRLHQVLLVSMNRAHGGVASFARVAAGRMAPCVINTIVRSEINEETITIAIARTIFLKLQVISDIYSEMRHFEPYYLASP